MPVINRRNLLGGAAALGLGLPHARPALAKHDFTATTNAAAEKIIAADNEAYWQGVAKHYDKPAQTINLENGYWGTMARPVLEHYLTTTHWVNQQGSLFARNEFYPKLQKLLPLLAQTLGVQAEELAISRNATEAMQALICGYNQLEPGDTVLYSDHDYDSMQTAMRWLKTRRGVNVQRIVLPEAGTNEQLLQTYQQALNDYPSTKLVLLTHLGHRTGLVLPVAKISKLVRDAGAEVIVDAAHSWGQMNFKLPELASPFIGLNLHKWLGAPIGVGLMYIRRDKVLDIDPYLGEADASNTQTHKRLHTGTMNFAAVLSVDKALAFRQSIGAESIAQRLHYLRNSWAAELPKSIQLLTPNNKENTAAITSFRLKGQTSKADNQTTVQKLWRQHGIFTVLRTGLEGGACVRVTPALFNSQADMQRLRTALIKLAKT